MKTISILGANGNIGYESVLAFHRAGWNVRALTRSGNYSFPKGVEQIKADALDKKALLEATDGSDFILNAINVPYPQWTKLCLPIARNVIETAKIHRAVHLFPANVYNYGSLIPENIDNRSRMNPDTIKGRIREEMEQLFEEYAQKHEVKTLVLRAGDFFGGKPSKSSWFNIAISRSLHNGKLVYPGPHDLIHSWAYLPDLAQAFVLLAEKSEGLDDYQEVLFRGHAVDGLQLKEAIQSALDKPISFTSFPWWFIRLASPFMSMMKDVLEMSYLWRRSHQMSDQNMLALMPEFRPTALEEAVRTSLKKTGIA